MPESDDPSLPALTFRVLFLGSILCVFGGARPPPLRPRPARLTRPSLPSGGLAALLLQVECAVVVRSHRPGFILSTDCAPHCSSSFFIILIAFPRTLSHAISSAEQVLNVCIVGHWMSKVLPDHEYSWFSNRVRFSLNPGPFNKKEHLLVRPPFAPAQSCCLTFLLRSVSSLDQALRQHMQEKSSASRIFITRRSSVPWEESCCSSRRSSSASDSVR